MPKTKISEYSATANSNTDVASINIDEGCAPSGINNAIRAIMGHLKDFQSGTSNDPFTVGSSGSLTLSYGTANGVAYLNGSKVLTTGSALTYSGGFLGIDTASPSGRLSLGNAGSTNIGSQLLLYDAGSAANTNNYGFAMNASTGEFNASAGTSGYFRWYTANRTETMNLTSTSLYTASGINVGIGTSSPQIQSWRAGTYLTVANATTRGQIEIDGAVADSGSASLGALIFTYSTNTTNHKDVALIEAISSGATANQRGGVLNFYTKANGTASPALNMTLDSSGNLLVGTATATGKLTISGVGGSAGNSLYVSGWGSGIGAAATFLAANTSNADVMYFNTSAANVGKISITSTATSYVTSSDYRLKENIVPMTGALAKVSALKPCTYTWKSNGETGEGFIAHELQEVCPHAVAGEKDAVDENGNPVYQGIDTSFLVATLTAAIQEQQSIIQSLTARITALERA